VIHVQRLTLKNLDGMTGLAGLADRTGVDIKPTLLRVLTDLYTQRAAHTPHEDQHFTELALRLIDAVDDTTRCAVAARLTKYPGTPRAVLERLAQLGACLSDPVSQHSNPHPLIGDDADLFESRQATWNVQSDNMRSTPRPVDYIEQRETFFSAPREERKLILMNLEYIADQSVVSARETSIVRYLEQAALAGRAQEFTTLLQQGLGLSRNTARRIVTDRGGEPFVVSARALTMPTDVFQRILMSLNPVIGQSVEMVFDLSDLFLSLPMPSALHLAAIWRAADRMDAKGPAHRRAHWDNEIPARRMTSVEPNRNAQPAELPMYKRDGSRR
jgi:hypothetical protein